MGKYAEALGIWEHQLTPNILHRLQPMEDDNLELVRLKKQAKTNDDETVMLRGIKNLYLKMVFREHPELTPEDRSDLDKLVGQNIYQIIDDMLIAFKVMTKEERDKMRNKLFEDTQEKK